MLMCLAIPACVEQLANKNYAIVNLGDIRKEISLTLVKDAILEGYVIVHVGFALQKPDPTEAERTLAMFSEISALDQENI